MTHMVCLGEPTENMFLLIGVAINKKYFQGKQTAFVLLKWNSDESVEEINM